MAETQLMSTQLEDPDAPAPNPPPNSTEGGQAPRASISLSAGPGALGAGAGGGDVSPLGVTSGVTSRDYTLGAPSPYRPGAAADMSGATQAFPDDLANAAGATNSTAGGDNAPHERRHGTAGAETQPAGADNGDGDAADPPAAAVCDDAADAETEGEEEEEEQEQDYAGAMLAVGGGYKNWNFKLTLRACKRLGVCFINTCLQAPGFNT